MPRYANRIVFKESEDDMRVEGKIKRTTSVYDNTKRKLIVSVPEHIRDKVFLLASMYGITGGFLITLLIDEMYHEPLCPTLPRKLKESSDRVIGFMVRNKNVNHRRHR